MFIGGDLTGMRQLAAQYGVAGGEFETNLTSIGDEADAAREKLIETMRGLREEAATLDTEMTNEMKGLRGQFDSTDATGKKFEEMNAILTDVETQVADNQSRIQGFLDDAQAVVQGSMSEVLNSLRESLVAGARAARAQAEIMQKNVDMQAQRFDEVLN